MQVTFDLMGSKEGHVRLEYAEKEYALASINYRLSQHTLFWTQLKDCKTDVR